MAHRDLPVQPYMTSGGRILVGWALALASFAYLLSLPPTLNAGDEAFLLYEAKRVLEGQALYRDVFVFLTPGSYYLYALAYAVGGISITSAKVAAALVQALSVACTYFLALYVASLGEAIIAGLLVVVVCAPVWSMASHHWLVTAFGLAAAALLLAPRWNRSSRARPAGVGALAGLAVCTVQGRGVWLIAGLAAAISLLAQDGERRWRWWRREMAWTAAGGAAVCVSVLGYAVWRSSPAEMWSATYTYVIETYRDYNVGRSFFFGRAPWAKSLFPGTVEYTYPWLLDSIPALLAIETVALLWAIVRRGLGSQLVRAVLLLVAFSALGGVAYFPDIVHVAFLAPFVLPVLAGMVYRARTAFGLAEMRTARAVACAVWIAALAMVLGKGLTNRQLAWERNLVLYDTAFGTIASTTVDRNTIGELREKLRPEPAPPRMFVYPSDAWINLALPADNPTPFSLLRPVYSTPEQFATAKEHLEREPRAFVLVNLVFTKPDDPFLKYVRTRFHKIGRVSPPIYELYGRQPQG